MFELIQHPNSSSKTLTFDNESLNVLVINRVGELDVDSLQNIDGILVQTNTSQEAKELIRIIRSNRNRLHALVPVFISSTVSKLHTIKYQFDGVFSDDTKPVILQQLKSIKAKLREMNYEIHQLDYTQSLIQSALQFSYSREQIFEPARSRTSKIGYAYPFLSVVLKDEEAPRVIEILNKSYEEGYTVKQTKDKTHTCRTCSGGYLNYRECCPKCGSADLKTEDLIHHFLCAHIAPEQDYKKEDALECPKCDKELRHIGIDYDKPSSMHTCNDCSHQFQQAEVKALCIDCGKDNELSQLGNIEIASYELTPLGEQAAKYGIHIQTGATEQPRKVNAVSEQILELFKKQEISREGLSEKLSWEGSVRIHPEIMSGFHVDQQEIIQKEMCAIITNYLGKADVLSSPSTIWYRFLVYDQTPESIEKIGKLIQNNISKLISDGIGTFDNPVEVLISKLTNG
ncbi:MAG: hypothetical protein JJ971_10510 [Balneolaceae bacterium]|nr:hypothetical protein [Balneolaceae bacterium]MBO6546323.1 hypothetical protein [Balneolaceae bacterium]MBO6648682.1 hypothetical protein [Balneolaceae bacterium]